MAGQRPSARKTSAGASIQDVAKAAGVSIATVSRVINSPNLVLPVTAQKVQAAIEQLGYRPNVFARGLMTSQSHVLGVALPDIHGEFYSAMLRGADQQARALGYHLLVTSAAHRPDTAADDRIDAHSSSVAFQLIDGLVLMLSEPNEALWEQARKHHLPTVVLDNDLHDRGVDSVVVDNVPGTLQATEHLLWTTAPDRCVFVGGPRENFDTQQRADVFRQTIEARKHTCREDQFAFGSYTHEWGRAWAQAALGRGRLHGSGVLAGNDEIALGIIQQAEEAGMRVPDDLRVVGFDDTRLAALVRPRLTTVRIPLETVGAESIKMLVRRIDHPEAPIAVSRLPTSLIVRDSGMKR